MGGSMRFAQLKELEWLNLYGSKVTDAGLLKLKALAQAAEALLVGFQSHAGRCGRS